MTKLVKVTLLESDEEKQYSLADLDIDEQTISMLDSLELEYLIETQLSSVIGDVSYILDLSDFAVEVEIPNG